MSELKNLVPPLELCKLIPQGEFEDSSAIWVFFPKSDEKFHLYLREDYDWSKTENYPAPTLQEILENSTTLCVTPEIFHAHKNYWTAQGENLNDEGMYQFYHGYSHNPATAALRLWLKLKELKHE